MCAKKNFNPNHWKNADVKNNSQHTKPVNNCNNQNEDVLKVISEIEKSQTDITENYETWLKIGFAFSSEFGEQGRDYFIRVSRFYNGFNQTICNKQFDKCLKSQRSGVTIRSFFEIAKNANLNIKNANSGNLINAVKPATQNTTHLEKQEETPVFPQSVYDNLPAYLYDVCKVFKSDREKDIVLLGTITALSTCLDKVYGYYNNDKVFPNLYLYVTAPASAGKGSLKYCKNLINHIHEDLKSLGKEMMSLFNRDTVLYNLEKNKNPDTEKPKEPPTKLLFIPANISSTGAFQLINDNEGRGIIFETEGDTLANSFKSDYGDYSDGFRKAFHHETISYYRRTNREYVDILKPKLSAVLTGTPKQILTLIPDTENGLFSRFMFYSFTLVPIWNNVFQKQTNNGFDEYFNKLGERFYILYQEFKKSNEIEFLFTDSQQMQFNQYFEKNQADFISLLGDEAVASVRRLGLIFFRIAMILSTMRIFETTELASPLYCDNTDFENTKQIIDILLQHSKKMFLYIKSNNPDMVADNMKTKFFEQLPNEFSRQQAIDIAKSLEISERTADKYLKSFIGKYLERANTYGHYKKAAVQSVQTEQSVQSIQI